MVSGGQRINEEETPDYDNPYVCAKIDELAGDNRN